MKFWKWIFTLRKDCAVVGHKWRYNFPALPNKRICERCGGRQAVDFGSLEWDKRFADSRTNKELIKKWF